MNPENDPNTPQRNPLPGGEQVDVVYTDLAHGADREDLARATWLAGARAVGWGSSESHRRAKALARAGEPGALEAMRAAAEPGQR